MFPFCFRSFLLPLRCLSSTRFYSPYSSLRLQIHNSYDRRPLGLVNRKKIVRRTSELSDLELPKNSTHFCSRETSRKAFFYCSRELPFARARWNMDDPLKKRSGSRRKGRSFMNSHSTKCRGKPPRAYSSLCRKICYPHRPPRAFWRVPPSWTQDIREIERSPFCQTHLLTFTACVFDATKFIFFLVCILIS